MGRARLAIVLAFGIFLFVGFAFLLGRALTGSVEERGRVLSLLEAQADGDAERVLELLPACRAEPACARVMRDRVAELERRGSVQILTYDPSVQVALTRRTGTGRVAWRAGDAPLVVQCVRVRRDGPLTGAGAELLAISAPIRSDAGCDG